MTAIRITYEYVGSFFLEWSPLLNILTFLSMNKDMTLRSRKSAPIYTQDHITENTWYEQEQKGTNK